jgi:ubiquinone/menaquinone biosynthesis C-methylase UbiE
MTPTDRAVVHLPTREGYDRWAEHYDSDGNPLLLLEEPEIARHLGDVRGLAVADIGCGTGRHALALAAAGARVTAVDFSAGMLARARAKPGAERVEFIEHDLAARLPLAERAFDRVLCCLVVDHIADLASFFAELGRICAPDGGIVVSVMHPALMLKGTQARFHDPVTGEEVRPASVPNLLSDYVMGALRAGLRITAMTEHSVDEALVARAPRAARYLGWPMLLMLALAPG